MGSLMFANFDDLITNFAKDQDLHQWVIIIASHEICGSLKTRTAFTGGVSTGINYESKYDNIEFVNSLRPTASIMEYAYTSNKTQFVELYNNQLISGEAFMDICTIVDMIVNNDCNVIITMSGYECAAKIPEYLRDFIYDQFGVYGYMFADLKRLTEYYNDKTTYEKIVESLSFDVPDEFTGRNYLTIVSNYTDDLEKTKETLELQKVVAVNMTSKVGEENDLKSIFFNRFTEDLEDKLKEMLLNRSENDIKDLCRKKHIRIAPGSSKEMLVSKIIHEMKIDTAREVEYIED